MRILDCKSPVCSKIAQNAPVVTDYLCDDCREHFESVKKYLTASGIEYTVNPHIVRGLDYYTRTVFEFVSGGIGAQSTVCGGGRYDGLIKQMGGPAVPALGFAMGIERLMLVLKSQGTELPEGKGCDLYIAAIGENASLKSAEYAANLRNYGFSVLTDICSRGVKAQMKYADKAGAAFTVVLGDNEIASNSAVMRNMQTGEEKTIALDDFADSLCREVYADALSALTDSLVE